MRLISLEDHFLSEAAVTSPDAEKLALHQFPASVAHNLSGVGEQRIKDMDKGDMALQVISHVPFVLSLEVCQNTNDQRAAAIKTSNGRFVGFATLPMDDPAASPVELERCISHLGFIGAMIPNHAHGRHFDGEEYLPLFRKAESLDVPIYLHPAPAAPSERPGFAGNYPSDLANLMSNQGWGWHADCALHFLRLYSSGLFDKCPGIKIILGHNGEMLPYMIDRINMRFAKNWGSHKRDLLTVWEQNIWITTSGMWSLSSFACLIRAVNLDRIMYSLDYPFEINEEGKSFMGKVKRSGLVTDQQFEMIAHGNAEILLRIKSPK
jgi:predicted TIM-barrel fold metal-dependent hydrolase